VFFHLQGQALEQAHGSLDLEDERTVILRNVGTNLYTKKDMDLLNLMESHFSDLED
jgi:hypothetical protein